MKPSKMDSVAQGVKDNRRLTSFTIDEPHDFLTRVKGLYNSELEQWLKRCPKDSWKYSFLEREKKISDLRINIQRCEAELW